MADANEIKVEASSSLVECEYCGSVEFCLEKSALLETEIWVTCRNCDHTAGMLA